MLLAGVPTVFRFENQLVFINFTYALHVRTINNVYNTKQTPQKLVKNLFFKYTVKMNFLFASLDILLDFLGFIEREM